MSSLAQPDHHIRRQAEILIPAALDHGFDYRVPGDMALAVGDVVQVPFGRGQSLGVVTGPGEAQLPAHKIKAIAGKVATLPALSPALLEFIRWAAWYNCAPLGAVLKMVLPIPDMDKKVRDDVWNKLLPQTPAPPSPARLSEAQQQAADTLTGAIGKGFSVTLLDGVTGSGKTEVYFQAIADILKQPDGQVLILLPEIALSVQWLERFTQRFGFTPLVWHSSVTPAQRRATFAAIASGEARVVVGARSALFLPYRKLGMLVVDEEHDASFKQEEGVMYHARDMAVARARFEQVPAVLVSATPSLETYENGRQGKYAVVSLPHRHNAATLPQTEMIDMRQGKLDAGQFISPRLREVLCDTLAAGHQSLLFLNRRGYAPLMLCRHCGHRFECPDCSSWLVLHKKTKRTMGEASRPSEPSARPMEFSVENSGGNQTHKPQASGSKPMLRCHHCDYRLTLPEDCPSCGESDSLHACGPGVERLHEEVCSLLPQARVAVLASDQAHARTQMEHTIQAMDAGQIDILIGTQMIAKGHHFPQLATVGVVDADLGLAGGDLRAAERTYQLLHQLSGRAGRAKVPGHVYLQSYLPQHPVMQALLAGGRDAFFAAELEARKQADMPPFARLAAIIIEGKKEQQVINTAKQLATRLQASHATLDVFGPAPAPLTLLRGRTRWRLLIRAGRQINLPDYLKKLVPAQSFPAAVKVKIDMDPQSFM